MRRAFIVMLVLVEAMFFNIVLPSHTRGSIQLPGSKESHSCCKPAHSKDSDQKSDEQQNPSHCAICAFAAMVIVPPAADFVDPPSGFAHPNLLPAPETVHFVPPPVIHFGRAPPT